MNERTVLQVALDLDEETLLRLSQAAQATGMSIGQYIAALIREDRAPEPPLRPNLG